jgi:hypothetical protein
MMNLREYFNNILNTQGYDAWCDANNELVDAVEADEELFMQDEEAHYVDDWAQAHNIDLEAGKEVLGMFTTYLQLWMWDNFED